MELTIEWWGSASFRISFDQWTVLLDPFLSRNENARPKLAIDLDDAAFADCIFLSNGHFNHIADISELVRINPRLKVFGPPTAIKTVLRNLNWNPELQRALHVIEPGAIPLTSARTASVEALNADKAQFDFGLIVKTLARIVASKNRSRCSLDLLTHYPGGESYSYHLNLGGYRIQFIGSAGVNEKHLLSWEKAPAHCLLLPLQGPSKVCQVAASIVARLKPAVVIPHHHDDFYPPLSQMVDISEFKRLVHRQSPTTRVVDLGLGQSYSLYSGEHPFQPEVSLPQGHIREPLVQVHIPSESEIR